MKKPQSNLHIRVSAATPSADEQASGMKQILYYYHNHNYIGLSILWGERLRFSASIVDFCIENNITPPVYA